MTLPQRAGLLVAQAMVLALGAATIGVPLLVLSRWMGWLS